MNNISFKQKLIIIGLILVLAIIIFIVVYNIKNTKEEEKKFQDAYVSNEVVKIDNENKPRTKTITDVEFVDLEKLSAEQQVVQDKYFNLILNCTQDDYYLYGKANKVEIKDIDKYNQVTVTVYYENGQKDYVVSYGNDKHNFLRCVDKETYEKIQNGDFAG